MSKTEFAKMKSFMAKNCSSPSIEDMKKTNDKAFEEKELNEKQLIEAYTNKKLKSKKLIKHAEMLINKQVSARD